MPLSLKEAEAAAYTDPSQENLAVYVKLLEESIEDLGYALVRQVLEDHDIEPGDLEDFLDAAPSREDFENMRNLCVAAADAVAGWGGNTGLAESLRKAAQ